jgi:stearoyl-CoA desaturase (delta-9 desaturase)
MSTISEVASAEFHPRDPTVEPPAIARLPQAVWQRVDWAGSWQFLLFHALALLGVVLVPPSAPAVALAVASFYVRILAISLGYHRYFAHRTFKTSRAFQFVLAFLSQTSAQKGVLWWAGHHRIHHRYPDEPDDVHSPTRRGFFWGHVGWIMTPRYEATRLDVMADMARYPELRWLDRHKHVPTFVFGASMFALGGWTGLVWGFLVGTVLLWHVTFAINSVAHLFGSRRYPTTDTSRNNVWLAVLTGGEGWHNNHHYFCSSARLGFRWWEFDPTYYLLWTLEKLGIVWDVRRPPTHVVEGLPGAAGSATEAA